MDWQVAWESKVALLLDIFSCAGRERVLYRQLNFGTSEERSSDAMNFDH